MKRIRLRRRRNKKNQQQPELLAMERVNLLLLFCLSAMVALLLSFIPPTPTQSHLIILHTSTWPNMTPILSYPSFSPWQDTDRVDPFPTSHDFVATSLRPPSRSFLETRFLHSSRLILVDQSGFGHFCTIQAAVNSIPVNNTHNYTILVAAGTFEEKVIIPHNKPFITLQGLGSTDTIIRWHDTAATYASDPENTFPDASNNKKPLGTFHSATVAVNAPNFIARDITFQNSAPAPTKGVPGGQAVALQVSGDKVAFYDCKFLGRQDTLYDHRGRHYFKNCYIEGSIDFIFGDGLSLYKECEIHAIGSGFITAQKRQNDSEDTGFSFVDCEVTGTDVELYLGRAWGRFSRVVYLKCHMDDIIAPEGWHNWGDSTRELTVFYSEYNCSGTGARGAYDRVPWSRQLTDSEAAQFMDVSFVHGHEWLLYE